MKEELKEKITLKDDQPGKVEISAGSRTIVAVKGEPVEVPLRDLQMWLDTGRFDWIQKETDNSDLPQELPGRAHILVVKPPIDLAKLRTMDKAALEEIPNIGAKTADAILEFLDKNGGSN